MFKKLSKVFTIILILILIAASVMVVITFASMSQGSEVDTSFSLEETPRYHFMVIIDGSNDSYVEQIREGLDISALYHKITYEFWDISSNNTQEDILQQFDIGVYSSVDGIIVNAYNTEDFEAVIEKANEKGIPIITVNEDIPNVEKTSHMGLNQYSIGSRIGTALNTASLEAGTIVVLQNENLIHEDKANGIYDNIFGDFEVKIETIESQGPNLINVEGLTRQIINQYSDLRAIVCNDSQATIGAVEALKYTNMVGDILIIGFGFNEQIQGYIEKEVIYSTVIVDYKDLGYKCIESLVKAKLDKFVSAYSSVSVAMPTKDTLNEYLVEAGLIDEETAE